ncbi:SIS domain-containing protein [Dysgonomonas sp. 520]|uniref:D-sedoheptulose-7-phosphate isomerase n=1 Tax=Dysgonomonas sp. 520 TaxID=2302931 RepID=UPI0013D2C5B8|nr:D-sedoheptulose 7-phosphate isomerase [Dysgonomonas sp. 520]NDW09234.1 SIS domain-containing protein [Dysgonomonas sp. 520]
MNIISRRLKESIAVKQLIIEDVELQKKIESSIDTILECLRNGGSVYFCGNGGSAADAQHLAAELSGRFYFDRQPLSADALHCNTSFLTAVANDYSFNMVYSRLISGIGRAGDVLVGLSTSGNSENIVKAFEKSKELGLKTIAFTGESGGKLKQLADITINVPSSDTPRIQESHITIGHIICEVIEEKMFGKK